MKSLIVLACLLASSASYASKAGDLTREARVAFNRLSATQALEAGYATRAFSIYMPGTSSWFNPSRELCQNGNTVQTIRPISFCTTWESEDDGDVKRFPTKSQADDFGGNSVCVERSAPMILWSSINYQENVCVLWEGRKDGETRQFKSRSDAKRFDNRNNASCVQTGVVNRTMATTYKMEFFRKVVGQPQYDSKYLLGSHTYAMASCHAGVLTPVPAN